MSVGITVKSKPWLGEVPCRECEPTQVFFKLNPEASDVIALAIHHRLAWLELEQGYDEQYRDKREKAQAYAQNLLRTKFAEDGELWIERVNLIADSFSQRGMRCEPCPFLELIPGEDDSLQTG